MVDRIDRTNRSARTERQIGSPALKFRNEERTLVWEFSWGFKVRPQGLVYSGQRYIQMKKLLVDSDFLVGVFRHDDANHQKAMGLLEKMKEEEVELWMSNLVHQESAMVVSYRVGMEAVRSFVGIK